MSRKPTESLSDAIHPLDTGGFEPQASGFHLTYDLFLLVLRGILPAELVDRQTRFHLTQLCDTCRKEWRAAEALNGAAVPSAREPASAAAVPPPPGDPLHVSLDDLAASEERLSRLRRAARLARVDLSRLLRLPEETWPRRVANARTRFQSRAFASLLIEEARGRLPTAPRQAAALAALDSAGPRPAAGAATDSPGRRSFGSRRRPSVKRRCAPPRRRRRSGRR